MGLTPHPHLVCRGPRKSRAIPLLAIRAFVAYKKGENLPYINSSDESHFSKGVFCMDFVN